MNPTLQKKVDQFKGLQAMKDYVDCLDDGDDYGVNLQALDFSGLSRLAFLKRNIDHVKTEDELDAIHEFLTGHRAGHAAPSIAVEEEPSAAQVEKPRAADKPAPVTKITVSPTVKGDEKIKAAITHQDMCDVNIGGDPFKAKPEFVQMLGRAERPVQPAGGTDWIEWNDPTTYGAPPKNLDGDEAIAYRMRDGNIVHTDYPHKLHWRHDSKRTDIVAYRLLTAEEVDALPVWVEWKGGECPVDGASTVQILMRDEVRNDIGPAALERWSWTHENDDRFDFDIVSYRVLA